MKQILLGFLAFSSFFITAQNADFKSRCQEVYAQVPQMPKGILEAVSFSQTRNQLISAEEHESCSGLPKASGYLGLFADGKNYLIANLSVVSEKSGISVKSMKQNPTQELKAYALAFLSFRNFKITPSTTNETFKINYIKSSLRALSALPEGNIVNDFANMSELYEVFKKLNDVTFAAEYDFTPYNFNLETVFGVEQYKVLSGNNVQLSENGIIADKLNVYKPSESLSQNKSTEYGPAVWNAAPTCNFSSRSGTAISAITIHTIQGSYAGAISWSQNCASNVSFHYVIRSSDGQVTQMVLEANKAWHVGSENPYTIGYEHEGWVAQTGWYTTAMYNSSSALTRDICNSGYGINPLRTYSGISTVDVLSTGSCTRIKGHQHYPNQDHNDPGINWDWPRYYRLVNNTFTPTTVTTASGTIYDGGGVAGNYVNDERRFTLIQPAGATSVTLNFTVFNFEANWDYLYVYDGATTAAPLIGTYTGTTLPGTISSSGGSLLIEYRTDCATTAAGFAATFTSNATPTTPTDIVAPTTSVSVPANWVTQNFTASFTDADNAGGSGIDKTYYQVIDYDGADWRANATKGFISDNFDLATINPEWTSQTGTWGINNQVLVSSDQTLTNTNIHTPLTQNLSNSYLFNWSQKCDGTGTNRRGGFHYFCSDATLSNRGNSYFVFFRNDTDRAQIYEVTNDVFSLVSDVPYDFTVGQWYDIKVAYDRISGKHQVYINNALTQTWVDPTPIATGSSISFRGADCEFSVNNIKVYRSRATTAAVGINTGNEIRFQNTNPSTASGKVKSISQDLVGNLSSIVSQDVNVDWTAPSVPASIFDGTGSDISTTTSNSELSANWTTSADPHSGILHYWYAIGTAAGASNIVPWTSNNFATTATATGLSLTQGTIYYFSVKAENGAGLISNVVSSNGVQVVAPTSVPVAEFLSQNTSVCAGLPINFQNTSVDATTYSWSFSGASPATSTDVSPNVVFPSTGTYTVELTATGPGGVDVSTQQISVTISAPVVANFTTNSITLDVTNAMLTCQNSSTNANGYAWDFGDGGTSNDANPWHIYTAAGVYTVTLTAANDACPSDVETLQVTVLNYAGIEENTQLVYSIFPNPAKELVQIVSESASGTVKLFDNLGKVVFNGSLINNKLSLDVSKFANGMYRLVLETEKGVATEPVFVSK